MAFVMLTYGTLMDRRMVGQYLESYDFDALDGLGVCKWTRDPAKAMRFAKALDGFTLWRTASTVRPLRDDGKPNRPLSAHSIEMIWQED